MLKMELEYSFKSTESASFLDAARQLMETNRDFDSVFDITFCKPCFSSKIPVIKLTRAKDKRKLPKSKIPRFKKTTVAYNASHDPIGRLLGDDAQHFIKELTVTENLNLVVEVDKKIRVRKIVITATNK